MSRRKKNHGRRIALRGCDDPAPVCASKSNDTALRVQGVVRAGLAAARLLTERALAYLRQMRDQRTGRALRVCETASLGEKRFVAIVDVDGQRFLIGGAVNSVSVLAKLNGEREAQPQFSSVLQQFQCEGVTIQ